MNHATSLSLPAGLEPSLPSTRASGGDGHGAIALLASMGWVVRNYLLGDFLPALLAEHPVTVFSPLANQPEFRTTLAARGAPVEPLLRAPASWAVRRLQSRQQLYHFTWCNTKSMQVKLWRSRRGQSPWANWRNALDQQVARGLTTLMGARCLHAIDTAHTWCALRTDAADYYRAQFQRWQPALVFSPAPLDPREWVPIQTARALGIPTVVAILSWDNLSTKSRLPEAFDHYVVWSEKMRGELMHFYPEITSRQISVCGTPQFDFYTKPELRLTREEFCRRKKLDSTRPILMYGGVTPTLMPHEPRVVTRLAEDLRRGQLIRNPQLVVRLHPKDDGRRYDEFRRQFPEVKLEVPGAASGGDVGAWSPSPEDMIELVNTILHGDVHLNVASTLSIDAAVLDRPVVNVRYDLGQAQEEPSPGLMIYEYSHYLPIVASNGVRVAETPEALVAAVNRYLVDAALDREGRQKIVQTECGIIDGRAGRRIADCLVRFAAAQSERKEPGRRTITAGR